VKTKCNQMDVAQECHVCVRQTAHIVQSRSCGFLVQHVSLSFVSQCLDVARAFERIWMFNKDVCVVSHDWVFNSWHRCVVVVLMPSARAECLTSDSLWIRCVVCWVWSARYCVCFSFSCQCMFVLLYICTFILLIIRKNLTSVFLANPR